MCQFEWLYGRSHLIFFHSCSTTGLRWPMSSRVQEHPSPWAMLGIWCPKADAPRLDVPTVDTIFVCGDPIWIFTDRCLPLKYIWCPTPTPRATYLSVLCRKGLVRRKKCVDGEAMGEAVRDRFARVLRSQSHAENPKRIACVLR